MFIVRNIGINCSFVSEQILCSVKKLLDFFNETKEINEILEMQYLPEEYRARRILSSKTSRFTTISTTNR